MFGFGCDSGCKLHGDSAGVIRIDFKTLQEQEFYQERELEAQREQAAQLVAAAEQAASEEKEARRKLKAAWKAEMRRQDKEARGAGEKISEAQRLQVQHKNDSLECELRKKPQ